MIKNHKIQLITLMIITLITVAMVIMSSTSKINCDDPETWATPQGVRHCAVNGGE